MIIELTQTSASQVNQSLLKARSQSGTSGLAFTMVVVTDSTNYDKVLTAERITAHYTAATAVNDGGATPVGPNDEFNDTAGSSGTTNGLATKWTRRNLPNVTFTADAAVLNVTAGDVAEQFLLADELLL